MSENDLPPLDEDVLDVLRAERPVPEPVVDVKARMLAAVTARLDGPPDGGGGGGSDGGGGGAVSGRAPVLAGWRGVVALAASFALGFAVRSAFPPAERIVVAERVAVTSAPVPAIADSVVSAAAPDPPAVSSARPAASSSANAEPDNRSLAGERALLDVARSALANGDPDRALAAVARHEKTYPNGTLVEEREALAVKALAAAGRGEEARARGARYVKRWPNGLMRAAVEGALQSLGPR
jgi:hypothetical protein